MSTPATHSQTLEAQAVDDGHEPHLVPYSVFINVWLALVVMTGVTVGASYLDLKHMAITTAILIACVKGTLVCMYFMHMRYDNKIILWFVIAGFGTFATFLLLTFADYYYR